MYIKGKHAPRGSRKRLYTREKENLEDIENQQEAQAKRYNVDRSQTTTTVKPDGMGKDASAAIKEFLGKLKE
jgi:ribose 1,5-bisphosphokinase PhnN